MTGQINVRVCQVCGDDTKPDSPWCFTCRKSKPFVKRDKRQVSGEYTIVDWFSSRSSAGLIVEDAEGKRYSLYMSDVFAYLSGTDIGTLTLEETKKGSAYGWKVITKEAA
ncbi:hypothetical protein DFP94_101499 [Fontibacillus phaseoli]|uniref:Uncharacterized protein n=1 Tax=Fontibacillus phaseoli TaxID=1416533 RepID=A0A369BMU1_9BACL|nr:hypothetical protein [Fontibacillus phaseoli]RCX22910.1 hypothetical protein DFP94_101499 [Fontibacillus phaseoli]